MQFHYRSSSCLFFVVVSLAALKKCHMSTDLCNRALFCVATQGCRPSAIKAESIVAQRSSVLAAALLCSVTEVRKSS